MNSISSKIFHGSLKQIYIISTYNILARNGEYIQYLCIVIVIDTYEYTNISCCL